MVRTCVVLLVAVALMAPASAVELAADPTGDVVLDAGGNQAGAPPEDGMENLDLVGLGAVETKETVIFSLQLADLEGEDVFFVEDGYYAVSFFHNGQEFRLVYYLFETPDGKQTYSRLDRRSAEDDTFDYIDWPVTSIDTATGMLTSEVYRDDLRDAYGAAPFPGRTLDNVHVAASSRSDGAFIRISGNEVAFPFNGRDRMPDEGVSLQVLEFQQGLRQTGHALLWTDRPMRASNGEASTFVFTVTAENTGASAESFDLAVDGVPTGWHVALPEQVVSLEAGERKAVPVIVSTPFAHKHGSAEEFLVTMTSRSDAGSVGRAELGLYYHEVPQPAGHHDTVWFHSGRYYDGVFADVNQAIFAPGPLFTYLNTLEVDPNDIQTPVPGEWQGIYSGGETVPQSTWEWYTYISPSLAMGLDFDLGRTGTVFFPLQTDVPYPQATVSGYLYHWAYDEEAGEYTVTEVAELPGEPQDLLPGIHSFEWTFSPAADADLLPFADRQGLVFLFRLRTPVPHLFPEAEAPKMAPGGRSTLPLLEYRDPVQDQYASNTFLHFTAPAAAKVNPGKTRVLEGELHNGGDTELSYRVSLDGVNGDWAQLLVPSTGVLAPDATLRIRLAVAAPGSAIEGDAADVVVSVSDRTDPTIRALGRFYVAVDEAADLPDDAAQAVPETAAKDSPAAATLLVLATLALLAAVAGRRRHT